MRKSRAFFPHLGRSSLLAPEVIQSSSMDCGPAALKALLQGSNVRIGYDRLREACQTDVDGTSIDVLEQLANELGVESVQQMLPRDALLDLMAEVSPSIVVTKLDSAKALHFVVLWSHVRDRLQVMDPSTGRKWVRAEEFSNGLYVHTLEVDGGDWFDIIKQGPFLPWLEGRLQRLGFGAEARPFLDRLLEKEGWQGLCAADAAARLVSWLDRSSGSKRLTSATRRLFEHSLALAQQELLTGQRTIPPSHWFARPRRGDPTVVVVQGIVLLTPTGTRLTPKLGARQQRMVARLQEEEISVLAEMRKLVERRDWLSLCIQGGALVLGSFGALAELMIFRASSSLLQRLGVLHQRLTALLAFVVFLGILLLLDYVVLATSQQFGRQLEGRMRLSLLAKIPRLSDGYFRSRLLSDMAHRAHTLYSLRNIPMTLQELVRSVINLVVTVVAISLLQPAIALPTLAGVVLSLTIPVLASRWLFEVEERVQAYQGALSGFYLDALSGSVPLRTHGGEQALSHEQQTVLAEWFQSALKRQKTLTWVTTFQNLFGTSLSIMLVYLYLRQSGEHEGLLLLLFWAQRIPVLGQSITQTVASLAPTRTSLLRLLEPLRGADQEALSSPPLTSEGSGPPTGIDLRFERVTLVAGGHTILRDLSLRIKAGEHIGIVGRSGAGKSSLLSLLLGVHDQARGRVFIDEELVPAPEIFARLRLVTAWVDPAAQLWNESLLSNIQFGSRQMPQRPLAQVVSQSDLVDVLDRLPEGFQTLLGDGGALVSGGEGQRVRLARAMLRRDTRLVLLDEPFRGLDRERRRELMRRVRTLWSTATILCVTHDVSETQEFDRVLVVQEGEVVEDDTPEQLLARPSRYRQLLESDVRAASSVWGAEHWRRVRVQEGRATEVHGERPDARKESKA